MPYLAPPVPNIAFYGTSALPAAPRTGTWYQFPAVGTASTASMNTSTYYGVPIYVPAALTPVSLGINVSTAGTGAAVRAALYATSAVTGFPTSFLADLGSADATTTGTKTFATPPTFPGAGVYVLALSAVTANITIRGVTGGNSLPNMSAPTSITASSCYVVTSFTLGTGGTWPATFSTSVLTQSASPRVDLAF